MRTLLLLGVATLAYGQASPEFEVASVKPSDPEQGFINSRTPNLNVNGARNLIFNQITLRDVIMLAYGAGSGQIQGPDWLRGSPNSVADRFEIVAKVPVGATREQIPLMLQALLADRFHLAFHRENKDIAVFALEVDKGGPKMKPSDEAAAGAGGCARSEVESNSGATLAAVCTHITSADIAQQLQALAPGYFRAGPIVDVTNLKGTYDFSIEWINNAQFNAGVAGPSMFMAVEKQLGLRLERRKQSVEMLVIDKLDRAPTQN